MLELVISFVVAVPAPSRITEHQEAEPDFALVADTLRVSAFGF